MTTERYCILCRHSKMGTGELLYCTKDQPVIPSEITGEPIQTSVIIPMGPDNVLTKPCGVGVPGWEPDPEMKDIPS